MGGAERQSARMSKITNDGLTRSGTGCFIAVPMWQVVATVGVNVSYFVYSRPISTVRREATYRRPTSSTDEAATVTTVAAAACSAHSRCTIVAVNRC